jgi:hypothetical protein
VKSRSVLHFVGNVLYLPAERQIIMSIELINIVEACKPQKKRCEDCRWSVNVNVIGHAIEACLNSPNITDMYGGCCRIDPNTCRNYGRKWWKFWRSK